MSKRRLLLLNLGSPDAPTPEAVKRYLKQFLSDPFVIDIPQPLRYVLVNGLIIPKRKFSSAEAYEKVWTENGSPLVDITRSFAVSVSEELGSTWDVRWAMRYGSPSISSVLGDWNDQELYVVPLYPQYAESSTRTALEEVRRWAKGSFFYLQDFFSEPEFIQSEVRQIQNSLSAYRPDHLLLSFHGLPEHHLQKLYPKHCTLSPNCSDQVTPENRLCYRAQSFATARAITSGLDYPSANVRIGFQSRLGRRPWIKPYTDVVVEELAKNGARKLLVACPSFVADCLETLEEIQMRLSEQFISAGGEELRMVPAPNNEIHWVKNFAAMIQRESLEWKK